MKSDSKFVRDSNSSLKLLTFQLFNVREWETIKYAFAVNLHKTLRMKTGVLPDYWIIEHEDV